MSADSLVQKEKKYPTEKAVIRACPFCGEPYEEADDTNNVILCMCGRKYKVQVVA